MQTRLRKESSFAQVTKDFRISESCYRSLQDPISRRDWDDANLTSAAIDPHASDPAFGY